MMREQLAQSKNLKSKLEELQTSSKLEIEKLNEISNGQRDRLNAKSREQAEALGKVRTLTEELDKAQNELQRV